MSILPIAPVLAQAMGTVIGDGPAVTGLSGMPGGFAKMLTGGIADVDAKVAQADKLARAFVLDDSIPVHQVTYALEQARMSLEMMLQVRSRIIDSYQQLMTMQL
jgi:flagellar hook-basal body complex protein FliE